ncbi:Tryptase [Orchesella cincta]|uniref:Tryptase n=1 Tax=Orchesella cincta TaxID=48709 RepID=A0A1D2N7Z9_ORCCI|nr:Tryptase [Orchesella cincta]
MRGNGIRIKDSLWVDAAYSDDDEEGELHFDALDQPDEAECMTLDARTWHLRNFAKNVIAILFSDNGELRTQLSTRLQPKCGCLCVSECCDDGLHGLMSLPIIGDVEPQPEQPQSPCRHRKSSHSLNLLIPEEPEPQPEAAFTEDLMKPSEPTEACPAVSLYNTWPSFDTYPFLQFIHCARLDRLCSGSLIDNRHVLTAAHCLHRFNSRDVARMQVRIGFTKSRLNDTFNDYYLERKASKIIFHKRFHEQSKMDNNIALVQLDQPVEFDEHVAPIGIFSGARGFDTGNCSGVEAGWIKYGNRKVTGISGGVIHYIEPPTSDFVLREAINRIYTNEECQSQLFTEITEDMLCAKTDIFEAHGVSASKFKGNDGGPLVIRVGDRVQQVGIKSWAYEGNQYPTIYTRVENYVDWIRNNLQM